MKASPFAARLAQTARWLRRCDPRTAALAENRSRGRRDDAALPGAGRFDQKRSRPAPSFSRSAAQELAAAGFERRWRDLLAPHGFRIAEFIPSNCAVEIHWSQTFRDKFESQAIKTAAFSFGGRTIRGEAVVTRRGLEGGPVYALSKAIGEKLRGDGAAKLAVDLKPDVSATDIARRLDRRRKGDSLSNVLRKTLHLSPLAIGLLREAGMRPDIAETNRRSREGAATSPVAAVAGLDRAISTAGGRRARTSTRT